MDLGFGNYDVPRSPVDNYDVPKRQSENYDSPKKNSNEFISNGPRSPLDVPEVTPPADGQTDQRHDSPIKGSPTEECQLIPDSDQHVSNSSEML